jgi:hypothetical protein
LTFLAFIEGYYVERLNLINPRTLKTDNQTSHDPVVEVRRSLVHTGEKSRVIERTVKRGDRWQGGPGTLVESYAGSIPVHR